MNTLICIPCLLTGGTEIQTLNTVHALVQGGHEVTVACYFEHTPDMVERYRKAGARVILFSPEGVRVGGYKSILFLNKHLRRTVKAVRPDVTHVQYMAPGATVILLLWLMGVKNIIATAHTAADIYRALRLIHFLQRHCLRAWTCITERAESSFFGSSQLYTTETVLGRRNHFTIYNSLPVQLERSCNENVTPSASLVPLKEGQCANPYPLNTKQEETSDGVSAMFEIPWGGGSCLWPLREADVVSKSSEEQSSRGRGEAPYTLGVVSRLEPIKGMDLVVPAFAEVLKQHPATRLLVVGDGTLRASMEEQAAQLGCADRIRFVGRQPQEELARWYGQMDIVLMPSRSEGFGLTAIEAMASGCVMVASDVGGLPEVVRDGVCGLLHRTEDVADMAAKICSLIGDEPLYTKLRNQSLREVEKYSFERYAGLMNDLYNRLGK